MPKQVKISKDDILRAALEIVRNDGIERVSNREIAKKLKALSMDDNDISNVTGLSLEELDKIVKKN